MVNKMQNQIKLRLYITLVAITLLWQLCMGVINIIQVQDIRSLALTECIKDSFNLFDICYRKTNNDIHPTLLNYISPFIPAIVLIWISWVFKLNFQIEIESKSNKLKKILLSVIYFIAFLGFIFPFFIVYEKEVERLYDVAFNNLFLAPWIAISWISIPIFFQKLLDSEKHITEFNNLHRVIYVVAASPIISIIFLIARQELKI